MPPTPAPLTDAHIHLDDPRFDPDRQMLINAATQAGVNRYIVPSTSAANWARTRDCCAKIPQAQPAYGLHPYFTAQHQDAHLEQLDEWLDQHPAIAIGECGLDYYDKRLDPKRQQQLFHAQLDIAQARQLPLIVHSRKSLDAIILILRQRRAQGLRIQIHAFTGSEQQAQQLLKLDALISFGALLNDPRAQRLRHIAANIPEHSYCLESDAPDQAGPNHRGQRNQPAWLLETAQTLAELRQQELAQIAAQTNANVSDFFQLPALARQTCRP